MESQELFAVPIPESASDFVPVYNPRIPGGGRFYQCVEAHFETLETEREDRYERRYGFWRPRVKCEVCGPANSRRYPV